MKDKILENEKIKLSSIDSLRYYRLPILFLIVGFFCITRGLTELPFHNFSMNGDVLDKIGTFALILSLVVFLFFRNSLKVKFINFSYDKSKLGDLIESIESNQNWKLVTKSENYLIIKTKENANTIQSSKNPIISPNTGNQLYIGFENKKFFVKSLFNLSSENFLVLNNGESKRNEDILIELIKSTL